MEAYVKEYADALTNHLTVLQNEMKSKLAVRQSYYRLMAAKSDLRSKERELVEETERIK